MFQRPDFSTQQVTRTKTETRTHIEPSPAAKAAIWLVVLQFLIALGGWLWSELDKTAPEVASDTPKKGVLLRVLYIFLPNEEEGEEADK